jgi:hypothetical protein
MPARSRFCKLREPHGLIRAEALKKAGLRWLLRQKAYQRGVVFAKRGRPKKN